MIEEKPTCFIIMPLTIPHELLEKYNGEEKHFYHVLENLFIPAIQKSGLEPVSPITRGSEIIQAEIIKKLAESDLVLCDMSILNPNVFFEFGIRTALDKPIALVVDDKTQRIPFDASIINFHRYDSFLDTRFKSKYIDVLVNYIRDCLKKEDFRNSFWKYFGCTQMGNVKRFDSSRELLTYILKRMVEAKESIRDLTSEKWVKNTKLPLFYDREDYEKYICTIEEVSKGLNYREIIVFDNESYLSKAKRLTTKGGKYYQLVGYPKLPYDSPQFWSYMIIDDEVIFGKNLAIRQPEIVNYFSLNFDELWESAVEIKIGGILYKENLERFERMIIDNKKQSL